MDTLAPYLLKSIISSAVLTGYYWLWLRNKKFHNYNRFFLLSAMIISLVMPLFNFGWYITQSENSVINNFIETIGGNNNTSKPAFYFTWQPMLQTGIFVISLLFLTILFTRILRLYRVKRSHSNKRMQGYTLIETQLKEAPFSFLNNLFWRSDISLDDENGKKIHKHELTHIREKHTYDKLFSQTMVCIFWMNPFYWLIQKELNMIHEFIADSQSIRLGDTESFGNMLLQSHNGGKYLDPSHSFFQSPVKRRLSMVANTGKTNNPWLRKIAVTPIMMLVVMMFSFSTAPKTQKDLQTITDLNDGMNKKLRDEKIAAEKAAVKPNLNDVQNQVKNNNISQAALLSAPFLAWKFN